MTEQEKYEGIINRFADEELEKDDLYVFMVLGYLNSLSNKGLIEGGEFSVTQRGEKLIAVCKEFDFKPSDSEILEIIDFLDFENRHIDAIYKFILLERDGKIEP